MTDAARNLDTLPASMQDVAETPGVGYDAALVIIQRWGGTRLYVHAKMTADKPLARAIGLAKARALAARYGNEEICVPRAARRLIAIRNAAIRAAFGERSAPALARQYGLTERQIRNIVTVDDASESPQADLL